MRRKDVRSLTLCLLLGDGSMGAYTWSGKLGGSFTIDHGMKQADYQRWKAELLSKAFNKPVKTRSGHRGKSLQLSIYDKRFRSWHKRLYRNGRKNIPEILKYIRHPEFALATLLMDDGYVQPSFSILKDGSKKNYGSRIRIFTCDQDMDQQMKICDWFRENFNVELSIKTTFVKKRNKAYPYLKFNQEDSLKVWPLIREFVLQFESMKYKFRYLEEIYQRRLAQRTPSE